MPLESIVDKNARMRVFQYTRFIVIINVSGFESSAGRQVKVTVTAIIKLSVCAQPPIYLFKVYRPNYSLSKLFMHFRRLILKIQETVFRMHRSFSNIFSLIVDSIQLHFTFKKDPSPLLTNINKQFVSVTLDLHLHWDPVFTFVRCQSNR